MIKLKVIFNENLDEDTKDNMVIMPLSMNTCLFDLDGGEHKLVEEIKNYIKSKNYRVTEKIKILKIYSF